MASTPTTEIRPKTPDSVIGRLLQELSWSGKSIRQFRDGGLGFENVLTAEALMGLDFLPRAAFLGAVLKKALGADDARARLIGEIEAAEFVLLPDQLVLAPKPGSHEGPIVVQPDGVISSPGCYALVEAKRIKTSSFQAQQLAREVVALLREVKNDRIPLLLLVLGSAPPVNVSGHGRLSITDAVELHLQTVLDRVSDTHLTEAGVMKRLPEVIAWVTWQDIGRIVDQQAKVFTTEDPSTAATVVG